MGRLLLVMIPYARPPIAPDPSRRHYRATASARRRPFRRCRIGFVKTSTPDFERGRRRAPNLRIWDRLIAGLCSLLIRSPRLVRTAIALKPNRF